MVNLISNCSNSLLNLKMQTLKLVLMKIINSICSLTNYKFAFQLSAQKFKVYQFKPFVLAKNNNEIITNRFKSFSFDSMLEEGSIVFILL